MHLNKRTRGAITVFLLIIMLPTLTAAVLLVDASRYQAARTILQEAGDLAAYSTIAGYDIDLKDAYGLFALEDGDVNSTYNQYFKNSLGPATNDGETSYSDQVQSFLKKAILRSEYGDKSFFDLYHFDQVTAEAKGIYPLSDPAVLQNQIVEYSKYRGVETILERFEILNQFGEMQEELKRNQEVVKAAAELAGIEETSVQKVSEGIGDLVEACSWYCNCLENARNAEEYYRNAAAIEICEMALMSDEVSSAHDDSQEIYEDAKGFLSNLESATAAVIAKAETVQEDANAAIESLKNYIQEHPEQPELTEGAEDDIKTLEAILRADGKYSLLSFIESMKNAQTRIKGMTEKSRTNMNAMEAVILDSRRRYENEVRNKKREEEKRRRAEENGEVVDDPPIPEPRYHIYYNDGNEWFYTKEDSTNFDYERIGAQATLFVESFAPKETLDNLGGYRRSYANIYEDEAKEGVDGKEDELKQKGDEAIENANQAKNRTNDEPEPSQDGGREKKELTYQTISDEAAAALPSKCENTTGDAAVPDVDKKSSKSTFDYVNQNSGLLNALVESGRNDILTYCYMLDTFKTRLTGEQITKDDKPGDVHERYLVDWRYSESGETDMRNRVKLDQKTFFATNEVEYIFGGFKSELANASVVYGWIYAARFINNFASFFVLYNKDEVFKMEIMGLAAAASAATAGFVPVTVFKWIFLTALAAAESALDLSFLIDDGFRIPLIKTHKTLFLDGIAGIATALDPEERRTLLDGSESRLNISYEDYLIVLLCFVDRNTRLQRMADLIQLNMQARGDTDFKMSEAYTYISASTSAHSGHLFASVSQFQTVNAKGGFTIKNTIYQGY